MGRQEDIFLDSEGDAWFNRNIYKLNDRDWNEDPVFKVIYDHRMTLHNRCVAEFGCADGSRLNAIYEMEKTIGMDGISLYGMDPSAEAISNGRAKYKHLSLSRGTATSFPILRNSVGILIYGFCLYVCDPEDHFEIATQADNLLVDTGYIIIHDFDAEVPHCVPNHHVPGLMSYKMDWSQLWLRHPHYSLIEKQTFVDGTAVWVLKKNRRDAFPCLSAFSGLDQSVTDTPAT